MSKKYYRFFWGFLDKQKKWLNEMADKGLRLVNTGRAWYEFEDCEPSKYRYAVEFVGEKSKQSAKEYASFLEDCGYRVLFKNLNLDYSVGKVIVRPWADKGGRIATTKGSYNKELLIVEKENDGKDFELHTDENDVIEYKKTVRKPWIFSITTITIILLLSVVSLNFTDGLGFEIRNATRIGYIGNSGWSSWSGKYSLLDGTMNKSIHPKNDILSIDVKTESGEISIKIQDTEENVIFDETNIGTGSYNVSVSGKVTVKIKADKHKGSFSIE